MKISRFVRNYSSVALPLIVATATFGWTLMQSQAQEVPADATPDAPTTRVDAFTPVSAALTQNDFAEAKRLLVKLKTNGLKPDQYTRWQTFAARTAVRLGDTAWLKEINNDGDLSTSADEIVTISAMRLLFANRLDEARSTLAGIKAPYAMSEIPKRRYEELNLKLEQLSGNKKEEQKWAGKLVSFVASWDSNNCQSCHANPKLYGEEVTHFDLQNWWVGDRYVQLIKESGEAKKVADDAEKALAKDKDDIEARIKLGYALRALGQNDESKTQLRGIFWSKWDDKPYKKPLRLAQFP